MKGFWATVCKTVRSMLTAVVLSVLFVCPLSNVGVLWPNGWMDQDATWYGSRPRPRRHYVRWGPSSPPPKGGGGTAAPQFSAHVCCGQTLGWIKMPFGTVGLGTGYIVLDGNQVSPQRGISLTSVSHLGWPSRAMHLGGLGLIRTSP